MDKSEKYYPYSQYLKERYGEKVLFGGKEYYLFPKMSEFIKLSLDDLKEFNLGFRDKYVYDAICVLKENPFYLEEVDMLDTEDAIKKYIQEQSDESRKEENKGNTGLQKYFDVD